MKILITGGCGFLGTNLAEDALEHGDDVIVFDNLSRFGATQNLNWLRGKGPFIFEHGDIRSRSDVERLIKVHKPEVIFHLAGQVAMTRSVEDPRHDFEVNAMGSLNLLEAVRQFSPETLVVYSSTNKVYGDLEQFTYEETETRFKCVERPQGFNEETTLQFESPYGCSKGCADQYMQDYWRMYGIKTVVFRHSSMYGGRQFATYDQGWVGWFVSQCVLQSQGYSEHVFTVSGSGKQVRDVLHARDMKSLYRAALTSPRKCVGDAFNIGGGLQNSLSILELLQQVGSVLGLQPKFRKIPERERDQKVFVADLEKVKNILGWQPKLDYKSGIANMIDWVTESEASS